MAEHRISGTTILYATLSGLAIGGPLHSLSLPNSPCSFPSSTTLQPSNSPGGIRGCRFDGQLQLRSGHGCCGGLSLDAGSPLCPKGSACGDQLDGGDLDGVKAESQGRMGGPQWLHASYC